MVAHKKKKIHAPVLPELVDYNQMIEFTKLITAWYKRYQIIMVRLFNQIGSNDQIRIQIFTDFAYSTKWFSPHQIKLITHVLKKRMDEHGCVGYHDIVDYFIDWCQELADQGAAKDEDYINANCFCIVDKKNSAVHVCDLKLRTRLPEAVIAGVFKRELDMNNPVNTYIPLRSSPSASKRYEQLTATNSLDHHDIKGGLRINASDVKIYFCLQDDPHMAKMRL